MENAIMPIMCVCCCQRVQLKTKQLVKHSEKFNSLTGDARKKKIESLRRSLSNKVQESLAVRGGYVPENCRERQDVSSMRIVGLRS